MSLLITQVFSDEGDKRADILHDGQVYVMQFYEGENLISSLRLSNTMTEDGAINVAEDYIDGLFDPLG